MGVVKSNKIMVRAKFLVGSNEPNNAVREEDKGNIVKLNAVTSGSPENESFFKWTPGGTIVLETINPEAAKEFIPGAEMYVDFTPVDTKG